MIYAQFDFLWLGIALVGGLLLGSLFSSNKKVDMSKIAGLSKKDFLDTKRMGTLVDVRNEKLFEDGKIVGAKNLPNKSGAKSSQVRKDIPIFIYDENGKRALNIAKAYVKAGAEMVYYLKGGYQSFIKGEDDVK